jgi:hypothetical protein
MAESFYYFFSATPQVLSGLLAIFGAIVIFKVQSIKSEMIGFSKFIKDEIKEYLQLPNINDGQSNLKIISDLQKAINRNDISELKVIIDKLRFEYYDYATHCNRFLSVFEFYENLKRKTINWSIITAAIISFCLSIIPLGKFLLKHECLLTIVFLSAIIGLIICFVQFISILSKSMKDTISTLYPDHYE